MGNSSSIPFRFRRRRHAEEISATDLLYTKPSGIYSQCLWDNKLVRRLILRAELAPLYPGIDDPCQHAREECPICMLIYPVLNQTRCCSARLCTECYLQIRPPRHNKKPCPFCKHRRLEASFTGPRDEKEMDDEEAEQRKALQAIKNNQSSAPASDVNRNRNINSTITSSLAVQLALLIDPNTSSRPSSISSTLPQPASSPHSIPPSATSSMFASLQPSSTSPLISTISATTSPASATIRATLSLPTSPSLSSPCPSLLSKGASFSSPSGYLASLACGNARRTLFVTAHEPTNADPIVLETMASEITYYGSSENDKLPAHLFSTRSSRSPARSHHSPQQQQPSQHVTGLLPPGLHLAQRSAISQIGRTCSSDGAPFFHRPVAVREAIRRSLLDK